MYVLKYRLTLRQVQDDTAVSKCEQHSEHASNQQNCWEKDIDQGLLFVCATIAGDVEIAAHNYIQDEELK